MKRPCIAWFLSFFLLAAAGAAAAPAGERVEGGLWAVAAEQGKVRVLVELEVPFRAVGELAKAAATRQETRIASAQRAVRRALRGTPHELAREYRTIPWLALEVSPEALARLEASASVRRVVSDRISRVRLTESVPLIEGDQVHAAGFTGAGTAVAILDTGVEADHPFFGGRVAAEACFSAGRSCPNGQTTQFGPGAARPAAGASGADHGNHVAGIAAGNGGVAPGAGILGINVFTVENGQSSSFGSDQIAALEWVLSQRTTYNVAAVNMSLGSDEGYDAPCDATEPAVKAAIDNLRSVGIATVIAAGNESRSNALGSPGCISTAVSVGATDKQDGIPSFSNSASFLTLLAPGAAINSSVLNGQMGPQDGTSMAAPHVAGAWALLKQAKPAASVDEVLGALLATGLPVADARNGLVKPRIRVEAARQRLVAGGGGGGGGGTVCGSSLCLVDGRFEVSVIWRNQYINESGVGTPLPSTDFAGYFAFNDPSNVELIVKILNFGDVVKIFYSQLTDLQFTMTVTDRRSGQVRQYGPTPGDCGAIDQAAFPGISGGVLVEKSIPEQVLPRKSFVCNQDETTLCLLDGRFVLQTGWQNQYTGNAGSAGASRYSNLTGQFSFDDPRNIELLTKVLDFSDRILFFYGALSDLEFRIRVTDQATGRVKEFYNPPGRFCGGKDTNF
jgi:hypothetical protein